MNPAAAGYFIFVSLTAIPLLVTDLLVFIALLFKHDRWYWAFAVLLVCSVPCLTHYLSCGRELPETEEKGGQLCIISWNAKGFSLSGKILDDAGDFIKKRKPDLICLQERPHDNLLAWEKIRDKFSELEYTAINSREDEVLNLAIFCRWPIADIKEFYFPDSYNKILRADIKIGNKTIRLFNVHLQTTGASTTADSGNLLSTFLNNAKRRNMQAKMLAAEIKESPYPVIVCGDFNDNPSSYAYRTVSGNLKDCFLQAGKGWGGSYQPLGGVIRIDYILCSDCFNVYDYGLTGNAWSDHKIQECRIGISHKSNMSKE